MCGGAGHPGAGEEEKKEGCGCTNIVMFSLSWVVGVVVCAAVLCHSGAPLSRVLQWCVVAHELTINTHIRVSFFLFFPSSSSSPLLLFSSSSAALGSRRDGVPHHRAQVGGHEQGEWVYIRERLSERERRREGEERGEKRGRRRV